MKRGDFLIAFFATIVQFYNYGLFGLSASMLAKSFMPPGDAVNQLLNFFGILGITVIARPIGAIIFGYIGDIYGRGASIKIATILGIISTLIIATIPDFNKIGILSAYFLLISRMLFLMSQAGEIDATRIYVIEKITMVDSVDVDTRSEEVTPVSTRRTSSDNVRNVKSICHNNKNLANGVIAFCSQLGVLIAAICYYYSSILQYGWRINFILGSIGGLIVIILRSSFQESNIFIKNKASIEQTKINILEIIKSNKRNFLFAMVISGACGGVYHFLIIFFNTFLAKILSVISLEQAQINNIILISCYGLCAILSGFIADKINPFKQIIIALIGSFLCILSLKFFFTSNIILTKFLIMTLVCLLSFYMVPLQVIIQGLFETNVKARLCSLSHAIGGIFFSSSIPFLSTLIWQKNSITLFSFKYLSWFDFCYFFCCNYVISIYK